MNTHRPFTSRRLALVAALIPILLVLASQTASGSIPLLDPPPFTVTSQAFIPAGYTAGQLEPGVPTATATTPPAGPTPTSTTPAGPTPTSTTPAAQDWLAYVNFIRSLAGLPAVTENPVWSAGDVAHSKYMVKNQVIGHDENPALPFYSDEGNTAAANGNVAINSNINATDAQIINQWVSGPFHQLGIIDPKLNQTGFGAYREAGQPFTVGGTLDVLRGRLGAVPAGITFPVYWPANGKSLNLTTYGGNESPDPLTGCPGYTAPTGLPLYLQLGPGNVTPAVTASSMKQGATDIPVCVFDQTNYTNGNAGQQSLARSILQGRSAIVIIPQAPLVPGSSYTVSITTNGNTYNWTFNVAANATAN